MIIKYDTTLEGFKAWTENAIETKKRIISEGKELEFMNLIEQEYPDGIGETELNDLLRFEEEWLFDILEIY